MCLVLFSIFGCCLLNALNNISTFLRLSTFHKSTYHNCFTSLLVSVSKERKCSHEQNWMWRLYVETRELELLTCLQRVSWDEGLQPLHLDSWKLYILSCLFKIKFVIGYFRKFDSSCRLDSGYHSIIFVIVYISVLLFINSYSYCVLIIHSLCMHLSYFHYIIHIFLYLLLWYNILYHYSNRLHCCSKNGASI